MTQKDGNQEGVVRSDKERESDAAESSGSGGMHQGKRSSSGIASKWESMKAGFNNFKSRVEANRFVRISQAHDTDHGLGSSPESLDEIFERISQPVVRHPSFEDLDSHAAMAIQRQGHSR